MIFIDVPYKHKDNLKAAVPALRWHAESKKWYVREQEDADACARVLASLNGLPVPPPTPNSQYSENLDVEQVINFNVVEQYLDGIGYTKAATGGNYRFYVKKPATGEVSRDGAIVVYQRRPSHFEIVVAGKTSNLLSREDLIAYTDGVALADLERDGEVGF